MLAVGFGAGQALLQLLQVVRHRQPSSQSRWLGLLLVSALAYFLNAVVSSWVLALLANLMPGLMWLFCASVFDDHHRTKSWQLGLVAFSAIAPILARLSPALQAGSWPVFLLQVPQLLEFVFLILAVAIIAKSWRDDLVQARRRLRVGFCGFLVFYVLLLIFTREVINPTAQWFPAAQYSLSALVLLLSNALLLRFGGGIWRDMVDSALTDGRRDPPHIADENNAAEPVEERAKAANNSASEMDLSLLKGLAGLMQEHKIYREAGLSIGQLAARLDVPEYRLRQAINQGLGYRNFNDFLNSYRVQEAAQRMISEAEKSTPVLSIALDVGFKSISSFNKSFKDRFEVTPSTYRSNADKNHA